MRVITWNMGMANRHQHTPELHDQAWHYLLGLGPDLAFLQEALPPPWVRSEGAILHGPIKRWGSVIYATRFPLERFRLPEDSHLRNLGSYISVGVASLPDGTDAFVASVHAPAEDATQAQLGNLDPVTVSRPSVSRPRVNDIVFAGLNDLVGKQRFIVAGDWNTARLFDSAYPGTPGSEFFDRALQHDWIECAWHKNVEEVQTWFQTGNRPYQLDHVFTDPALADTVQAVMVASDAASVLALSDHAPLIIDFENPPISMTSISPASVRDASK